MSLSSFASHARYIVRAAHDDDALLRFLASAAANPAIHVINTIGPAAGPPHTVIIETDPLTAEQLRQGTFNQLMIEPDRPLSLF
jgi:hypothetical protein